VFCVAMVTASHNDNGWNRRQDGPNRPLAFGPDEMTHLKEKALNADFRTEAAALMSFTKISRRVALPTSTGRKLKVVSDRGNGATGA